MPALEHFGHYDSGLEDLSNERLNTAWNHNTTFSERAWAEASTAGCLNMFDQNRGCKSGGQSGGAPLKCKNGSKDTSQYDTFSCIPMRAPLVPNAALDTHVVGEVFMNDYKEKRHLRPDTLIPDDYASDSDGFCGPVDQGDIRHGYKERDTLGAGGTLSTKKKRRRRKKAAATLDKDGGTCSVKNVDMKHIVGCTVTSLQNIISDLFHWSEVPGSTVEAKVKYVFTSSDRLFYIGLFTVVLLMLVLVVKILTGGRKTAYPQQRYIMV